MGLFRKESDAWADWRYLSAKVRDLGYGELVILHAPRGGTVTEIDEACDLLREELGFPSIEEMKKGDEDAKK